MAAAAAAARLASDAVFLVEIGVAVQEVVGALGSQAEQLMKAGVLVEEAH